jgi:hypothetical protein
MIPSCCPQTWEHVGVMACALKMLDVGGIGTGNPPPGRLKKSFAVRCPIRANKVANGSPSPSSCKYSSRFTPTGRFSHQVRRPMPSRPSYNQLKLLGFHNLPHSRGASNPWTGGTRTPAPPIRSTIRALYFFYSRRCPFHAP